jgi:signal transduction histidine kinase
MADASHELRTPVTTTRTAATVTLQKPHRDERDYRDALDIIEQQAARLSRIVEDMFTLARADAGNYPVRLDPMYLDEVVEDVVRAARVIADTRGVTIAVTAEGSASFTGDEDLVRRMVGNLLDNAIRHAPAGSTVAVVLGRTADAYTMSITDRGPGIPEEIRPHIFQRFFRGDSSRARASHPDGGAGLGLALTRWIASVHQGDVRLVHSSAAGTTFTVFLPDKPERE